MALVAAIPGIVTGIKAAVTGIIGLISSIGLAWLAFKAFVLGIVYVGIPLLVYNFAVKFITDFIQFGMNYVEQSEVDSFVIELTGMGGWMAQQIQLPTAFSIFMGFLSIRFVTRFIPFMK